MASNKIDTKPKRDRLAVRREPYWSRIQAGGFVGYRRTVNGGTWIARWRDEHKKQLYQALTLPEHLLINEYDAAVTEARRWIEGLHAGVKPRAGTVGQAADDYLKALQVRKGERAKKDAEGRIERWIRPNFGAKRLDKVTTADIERAFHALIPTEGRPEALRKAKASANRNLVTLKAVLNYAHKQGLVASSLAWSRVKPFAKVDAARKVFLSPKHIQNLIEQTDGGFRDLLKAAALTGARYGELCALRVKNLDVAAQCLHITEGKTGERVFPLEPTRLAFFKTLARGKLPEAYLLTRDDGQPWRHSDQDELFRNAAKAVELPTGTVMYSLRHSFIAEAISAGLDIYSVATITGTSVRMIEKHYGKLLKDRVRAAMAGLPRLA